MWLCLIRRLPQFVGSQQATAAYATLLHWNENAQTRLRITSRWNGRHHFPGTKIRYDCRGEAALALGRPSVTPAAGSGDPRRTCAKSSTGNGTRIVVTSRVMAGCRMAYRPRIPWEMVT